MASSAGELRLRRREEEQEYVEEEEVKVEVEDPAEESVTSVLAEVTPPYLLAGLGMVGAGVVLDTVQYWTVYRDLPELFIMVPALIGLKGNLEMTLASRLSTHANLGHLDTAEQTLEMGVANLALTQVQGVVVGCLAAWLAMAMAWLSQPSRAEVGRFLVLCTSSIVTASLASAVLGVIMVLVIAVSRKYSVNPDNVATPIAAALGDLVTLGLLSLVASLLHTSPLLLPLAILAGYIALAPLFIKRAKDNPDTSYILSSGWTPVLSAMVISSLGGGILSSTIASFPDIAVFQPVINGVAGNLVGIQASRISTELHKTSRLGQLPPSLLSSRLSLPSTTFLPSSSPLATTNAMAARALLFLVLPGHVVFNTAIGLAQGFSLLTTSFVLLYLLAALLQVFVLLHIASVLVHAMWRKGEDPDNAAIPYLTALGDLLGGGLLAAVFYILQS